MTQNGLVKEEEAISKVALEEWIKSEMNAMGSLQAYSYRVGIYHGMKKVLEKIESKTFDLPAYESTDCLITPKSTFKRRDDSL